MEYAVLPPCEKCKSTLYFADEEAGEWKCIKCRLDQDRLDRWQGGPKPPIACWPRSGADNEIIRSFFPPTFNPFAEAVAAGVKLISIGDAGNGIAASHHAETRSIRISPVADWEERAISYNERYPDLGLTAADAIVFVFFHELGHATRREYCLKKPIRGFDYLPDRPLVPEDLAALVGVTYEEMEADKYAIERFRKWKEART
jgi:hypothetical protein